jgi:RHS repeat-associated protein
MNSLDEVVLDQPRDGIARERGELHWQQDPTHDSPIIKKVEYSDGFGRILQTRVQAEEEIFGATEQERRTGSSGLPADQNAPNQPATARKKGAAEPDNVVVSGWKVYTNKGKVVEEYEPFFDKGYTYKPSKAYAASLAKMTVKYDAGDRPTETEFPDGSKSLVVYGVPHSINNTPLASVNKNAFTPTPWARFTYDQNDLGPLTGGTSASTGAFTPKSETIDALGRTIKTTEHNSQPTPPTSNPAAFEDVVMKYEYDIQGNITQVIDPLDRQSLLYKYNLQKQPIHTLHIDSGENQIVYDVMGKIIESHDSKNAQTLSTYDRLQRPTYGWSKNNSAENLRLTLYNIYGEGSSSAVNNNRLGKLFQQYDEAGRLHFPVYDFQGNNTRKVRKLIKNSVITPSMDNYTAYLVDWTSTSNKLERPNYRQDFTYDALNRVTSIQLPNTITLQRKFITPHYNRAGMLEKVNFDGTDYVKHIAYNAKGQRLLIAYGNDIMTRYTYDNQTFRLMRQRSEKFTKASQGLTTTYSPNSGNRQDDAYNYDLTGNILQIISSKNGCGVGGTDSLTREFTYDPLYRVTSATGRENVPSGSYPFPGWNDTNRSTDPNSTTAYTRKYQYDKVGNIERLRQIGSHSFTRDFNYPESAGIKDNNKLSSIDIGSDTYQYTYDQAGSQKTVNTERKFDWDAANRLLFYKNQVGSNEPTVEAQYLYDASGNRVKKIVRKQGGGYEIRVYIDGIFEYFTDETEEQNTVHIMDDQSRIASVRIGASMGDSTPAVKYTLENNIGSSVVTLDDSGAVVNEQEYYPFGETSFGSYAKKRYQYTGKERDEESGLYYYGARYYAPWTCRFISVDPLASKYNQLTPYQNAGNDPIGDYDIDGMQGANTQIDVGSNNQQKH